MVSSTMSIHGFKLKLKTLARSCEAKRSSSQQVTNETSSSA
ncbi:MAG: hypothetical protein TQ35_0009260 [Candidatus Aramenus sulfurataquae]|uniref:Uncharacterized protein n=1 Tax=Candidatus Aramenus sulfurataquae TaxID=1326980 RepID=A0ACC6TR39_9CREN